LLACVVAQGAFPLQPFIVNHAWPTHAVRGVGYLINPFGSLTYAWLTRENRYESIR